MSENYIVTGKDEYLREREVRKICKKILSPGEEELDYSAYGPDDIDGIMDSVGTFPFMAGKRVVLVKNAHELSDKVSDSLLGYLGNPRETTVLILSFDDSSKESKALCKRLTSKLVERKTDLTVSGIKDRVRGFFKKEGVDISREAIDFMIEKKGADAAAITSEVEKLVAFSDGRRIEAADVERVVGRSAMETIFKLVDALNAPDPQWTFRALEDLRTQKKQPHEILGYLSWYIKMMQEVIILSNKGLGTGQIAAELRKPEWQIKKMLKDKGKFPPQRIEQWNSILLETDRDIKTGLRPHRVALEMMVTNLFA